MRHLRALSRTLAAWLASEMVYRENFLAAVLTALLETAGRVFALWAMLAFGLDLGGWRFEEALLVLGAAVFLRGFHAAVIAPNLRAFSHRVLYGTLDFVLLKPLDVQALLMLERVSLWGLPDLVAGGFLVGSAVPALGLSAGAVALYAAGLLLAGLVFYLLAFSLSLIAIRAMYVQNLVQFLAAFLEAGQYPATAYGRGIGLFFTFAVPVYWMTQVPAEVALSRVGVGALLGLLLWLVLLLVLSRGLLGLALRGYGSASS